MALDSILFLCITNIWGNGQLDHCPPAKVNSRSIICCHLQDKERMEREKKRVKEKLEREKKKDEVAQSKAAEKLRQFHEREAKKAAERAEKEKRAEERKRLQDEKRR
jgi:hypothetical protein